MTNLEQIKLYIDEAIDQTGLSAEEILKMNGTTIEELAEAMDQTGLSVEELCRG